MGKNYKNYKNKVLSMALSLAMLLAPLVEAVPVQAAPENGVGGGFPTMKPHQWWQHLANIQRHIVGGWTGYLLVTANKEPLYSAIL